MTTPTPAHLFSALPAGSLLPNTGLPPVLLSATPTGVVGSMSIALNFSTAMAAGSGTIIITDGAVETVIDRATGQPAMRVVGATDTHTLSASQLSMDGSHVTLKVGDLLPGHSYSVVMGAGVLVSTDHMPFGGVRSTSQLQFDTPPASDTAAPMLVSTDASGSLLKAGDSMVVTFKFSEAVTGLTSDALKAPNATVTALSSSDGITWHATLQAPAAPAQAASNVLTLDMSQVKDAAGNAGTGSSSLASYAVDTQAPTVTGIKLDGAKLAAGGSIVATLTFSEPLKTLDRAALSADHATFSDPVKVGDGSAWQVTLTGADATSASDMLKVDLSKVLDVAGNAGSGTAHSDSYTVDTEVPRGVSITLGTPMLKAGGSTSVSFVFSEAVKQPGPDAFSTPHATLGSLASSDGGRTWTGTLSATDPNSSTGNLVSVDLAKVFDLNGNPGSGSLASLPYAIDTVAPAVAAFKLDGDAINAAHGLGFTIQFSEAVKTLDAGAIAAPHASVGNLHSLDGGITWTGTLTATNSADSASSTANQLSLDMSRVLDVAGNAGSGIANADKPYVVDTQGPGATVFLSGSMLSSSGSLGLSINFTEAVRDLSAADIIVPNAVLGTLQHSADYRTWTTTLTPGASGIDTAVNHVSVDLGKVHDDAGNAGSGTVVSSNYAVDTRGPVGSGITLGGASLAAGGSMQVSFSFAAPVHTLPASAIIAPGATIGSLASSADGLTWTARISAADGVTLTGQHLMLDMAQVEDVNGNTGSGILSSNAVYAVDSQRPTVAAIGFDGVSLTPGQALSFSITFSEAIKTLDASAIVAPHASVGPLASSDGITWTGLLATGETGTSIGNQLSVDLGKLSDLAGNAGAGSVASSGHYDINPTVLAAKLSLDGTALNSGGSVGLTIVFSAPVTDLDASKIATPNATLTHLAHTDDYRTWTATLAPLAGAVSATNAVSIDLGKVHDGSGAAGAGTASSSNYTVDTTVAAWVAQAIYVDDAGPSDTDLVTNQNDKAAYGAFVGSVAANQHLALKIDGNAIDATYIHVTQASSNAFVWSYYGDDGHYADGVHTISAQLVDDQGHASAPVSRQFTVDTVAPHVLGSPDGATAFDTAGNLVLTFDKPMYWADGEGLYDGLQLHDADGSDSFVDLGDSHFSADHKTLTIDANELHLASGNDYTVYLPSSLTDLAGNEVGEYRIGFHTAGTYVDVTAPTQTGIVADVGSGSYGTGHTIGIRVRFNEPVRLLDDTTVLHLNNGAVAAYAGPGENTHELVFNYTVGAGDKPISGLDIVDDRELVGHVADLAGNALDNAHVAYMHLTDNDGDGYTIDIDNQAAAPSAPQLAPGSDSGVKGDNVTSIVMPDFTGNGAEPNAEVDLYLNGAYLTQTHADGDGKWTFDDIDLSAGLGTALDKIVNLTTRQVDSAGNQSVMSAPLVLTLKSPVPALAALAAGSDTGSSGTDLLTKLAQPTLTGTVAADIKSVQVWDGSTPLGKADVGSGGVWSFTPGWGLAHGEHTITLQLFDANGNVTPRSLSTPFTFRIDLVEPGKPGAPALALGEDTGASATDNITNKNTPVLTGTAAEAGGKIAVYDGSTLLGTADVKDDKSWTFQTGLLPDGAHTLSVQQVDAAGNTSALSELLSITVDTVAPTITARSTYFLNLSGWNNYYDLEFSEAIVFGKGEVDVLDDTNIKHSKHTWDVLTNWAIENSEHGVQNVLELNLGTYIGLARLQVSGGAIQDIAGNVAIIGSDLFNIHGPTA